jgi:5-methylcytosine-specific restriction endonuclease McrA
MSSTIDLENHKQTLLLNSNFKPLKVVTWQRAICMWFSDKVEILEEYDDFDLNSISFTMKCPAVIRLLKHVGYRSRPKFSRLNIFRRDKFSCLYCGEKPNMKELTFDHVVPKVQGGTTHWHNIVSSCRRCNFIKGEKTPEQAGMVLLKKPNIPSEEAYIRFNFDFPKTPDAWRSYLYWLAELKEE